MALTKSERRERIKKRIRKTVKGEPGSPRLTVFRSNTEIYAQLIDDRNGKTLATASSLEKGIKTSKGTKSDISKLVGKAIAEKAIKAGINRVVFDRNGFLYHGRIKSLAEGAREGGLNF